MALGAVSPRLRPLSPPLALGVVARRGGGATRGEGIENEVEMGDEEDRERREVLLTC